MNPEKTLQLNLAPRQLGAALLPEYCPRCFWLSHALRAPYQIPMPGIFARIDALTKCQVEYSYYELHGYPDYLGLDPKRDMPVRPGLLHWSKFQTTLRVKYQIPNPNIQPSTNDQAPMTNGRLDTHDARRTTDKGEPTVDVTLRGTPDALFARSTPPESRGEAAVPELTVLDFKTSACTEGQEKLLPLYQVQLGCYGLIAERLGWGRVKRMALVYWEPVQEMRVLMFAFRDKKNPKPQAVPFRLDFNPLVKELDFDFRTVVPNLVEKAAQLLLGPRPEPRPGCKECAKLDELVRRTQEKFAAHPEAA